MEWLIGSLSNKELKEGDIIKDNRDGSCQTILVSFKIIFQMGWFNLQFWYVRDLVFCKVFVWLDILIIQIEAASANCGLREKLGVV